MAATAQLDARSKLDHAHAIAVFFAEEGNRTHRMGLIHGGIPLFLERKVGPHQLVDALLDCCNLLIWSLAHEYWLIAATP